MSSAPGVRPSADFDGLDHLHAAGMAAEASDGIARLAERAKDFLDRAFEIFLDERRDCPVEDHRESRVLDVPAHDPLRVGPELLGAAHDRRQPLASALDDRRGGAVAEDCGRDDRGWIVAVEPDGDGAGLDGHEQPAAARVARRQPRGRRKTVDPARAAEPENGHSPRIVPQPETRPDARFEAWSCNAGRRDGDDPVDLVGREPRLFDRGRGGFLEQSLTGLQIDEIAVMPAVAGLRTSPWREHDVALGDPRIVENSRQPVEQGFPAPECATSAFLRFRLIDDRGWHGRRQGEEATRLHVETYNALAAIRPIASSEGN